MPCSYGKDIIFFSTYIKHTATITEKKQEHKTRKFTTITTNKLYGYIKQLEVNAITDINRLESHDFILFTNFQTLFPILE